MLCSVVFNPFKDEESFLMAYLLNVLETKNRTDQKQIMTNTYTCRYILLHHLHLIWFLVKHPNEDMNRYMVFD